MLMPRTIDRIAGDLLTLAEVLHDLTERKAEIARLREQRCTEVADRLVDSTVSALKAWLEGNNNA